MRLCEAYGRARLFPLMAAAPHHAWQLRFNFLCTPRLWVVEVIAQRYVRHVRKAGLCLQGPESPALHATTTSKMPKNAEDSPGCCVILWPAPQVPLVTLLVLSGLQIVPVPATARCALWELEMP